MVQGIKSRRRLCAAVIESIIAGIDTLIEEKYDIAQLMLEAIIEDVGRVIEECDVTEAGETEVRACHLMSYQEICVNV